MKKNFILVVDDDPVIAGLMSKALNKNGYTVYTADNARHALAMVFQYFPDLILLDYMLPDKDGLEFLRDIRRTPEICTTPVIMITSSGFPEVVSTALSLGVNDFIVKPFKIKDLLDRVSKYTANEVSEDDKA
ncbi:MAG: response regulator transcription factor [Anaerolineaceae bacterium]|nr:response regulator transcription factor [Anaerolineaceae bacterium]